MAARGVLVVRGRKTENVVSEVMGKVTMFAANDKQDGCH
jgi:hypothetical protein